MPLTLCEAIYFFEPLDKAKRSQEKMAAAPLASAEVYVPPINFSMLCPGVYRSGYPTKKNFRFLKALNLRSVCYLCPEEYAQTNLKFCEENSIGVLRFPMEGNKEPFVDIPEGIVHRVLSALCDRRHHPILIHCNKGKHRTGTICACLRKVQGWSLVSIFDEYLRFAGDKARVGDQQYIELYRPVVLLRDPFAAPWVEPNAQMTIVRSEEELECVGLLQLEKSLLVPDICAAASMAPSAASAEEKEKKEKKEKKDKKEKEKAEAVAPTPPQRSLAT